MFSTAAVSGEPSYLLLYRTTPLRQDVREEVFMFLSVCVLVCMCADMHVLVAVCECMCLCHRVRIFVCVSVIFVKQEVVFHLFKSKITI